MLVRGMMWFAALAGWLALGRGEEAAGLPVVSVAERYVQQALAGNLALQGRALEVAKARARLAEVSGALQPRVDFVARYSRADGGRTIDFPVGDLLNGAYATLNDYLVSQGRPAMFSSIENASVPLLRDREQETKLRLVQPLYRPELTRGIAAARAGTAAKEAELAAYRRELRQAVIAAYHAYLQAEVATEILASAAEVTAEAVRANRLLGEVGKVTEDRVLRAEAEDAAVAQQRAEAERDRSVARAYLNFLLNRPLGAEIERASEEELEGLSARLMKEESAMGAGVSGREELAAWQQAVKAADAAERAASGARGPTLALAVEGGTQGTGYGAGDREEFVQGSLVAELNIWDGRRQRARVEQARLARRQLELELAAVEDRLELELTRARDEFRAAVAGHRAAMRRGAAAARAFDLVAQREREGLVAQLSFLDARNEFTRAELGRGVARHRLFVAAAALDRVAAISPLP